MSRLVMGQCCSPVNETIRSTVSREHGNMQLISCSLVSISELPGWNLSWNTVCFNWGLHGFPYSLHTDFQMVWQWVLISKFFPFHHSSITPGFHRFLNTCKPCKNFRGAWSKFHPEDLHPLDTIIQDISAWLPSTWGLCIPASSLYILWYWQHCEINHKSKQLLKFVDTVECLNVVK